jgi:hypothetical protein
MPNFATHCLLTAAALAAGIAICGGISSGQTPPPIAPSTPITAPGAAKATHPVGSLLAVTPADVRALEGSFPDAGKAIVKTAKSCAEAVGRAARQNKEPYQAMYDKSSVCQRPLATYLFDSGYSVGDAIDYSINVVVDSGTEELGLSVDRAWTPHEIAYETAHSRKSIESWNQKCADIDCTFQKK